MKIDLILEQHEIKEAIRLYMYKRLNISLSQETIIELCNESQRIYVKAELQNKTVETARKENE